MDSGRGTGSTTRQIQSAPKNATFVWCNEHFQYARDLARRLGREDVVVKPRSALSNHSLMGLNCAVIVDHALFDVKPVTAREYEALQYILARHPVPA